MLRGVTWDHTRGFLPVVAAAQALHDREPGFDLQWEKRSLWAFGEGSLDELISDFDLLVVDHPWIPTGAEGGLILALDTVLPAEFLAVQARQSAGPSYRSYAYKGHQWALAIDAACEVTASRPDLMSVAGIQLPETFEEVLRLARETGRVLAPFNMIDALSHFFTLCANQGEPALDPSRPEVVGRDMGMHVLWQLSALLDLVGPRTLEMNPIAVLNELSTGERYFYCPFTFGYTNYSRTTYPSHLLAFTDLPAAGANGPAGSTLGGAGLAVSSRSANVEQALEFAMWAASADCQKGVYVDAGGQPGNRVAWEDERANELTGSFFRNTYKTLSDAFVRPISLALPRFQTRAGEVLHEFLRSRRSAAETIEELDQLLKQSRDSGLAR